MVTQTNKEIIVIKEMTGKQHVAIVVEKHPYAYVTLCGLKTFNGWSRDGRIPDNWDMDKVLHVVRLDSKTHAPTCPKCAYQLHRLGSIDAPKITVTDPCSGKRDSSLTVKGSVLDTGDYTNEVHEHVKKLVSRLDEAGVVQWEISVDKLIPRLDICECCHNKTGKVKDLVIALRVEKGISGAGVWEIITEEQGWSIISIRRHDDADFPTREDIWFYFKKVVK